MSRDSRNITGSVKRERKSVAVIGEGITEFYYLNSIKGVVDATIKPKLHKDGLGYVRKEISKCLKDPYDVIYCLVDMDNKKDKEAYARFYKEYHNKCVSRGSKRARLETRIFVIESHPCIEIWFCYFFDYTTACYSSFDGINPLKRDLPNQLNGYRKDKKFLNKPCGLHQYLIKQGGNFNQALVNSNNSITHQQTRNGGAYTHMKQMFDDILKDEVKRTLDVYKQL